MSRQQPFDFNWAFPVTLGDDVYRLDVNFDVYSP